MKANNFYLEKNAFIPMIAGAGLGALTGALTAPKGHRLAGALTGGAFGAVSGGAIPVARAAMTAGKGMRMMAARNAAMNTGRTISGTAGRVMRDTGIGAAATGALGGYN